MFFSSDAIKPRNWITPPNCSNAKWQKRGIEFICYAFELNLFVNFLLISSKQDKQEYHCFFEGTFCCSITESVI